MNLETKITIYKFTPQVFTLTRFSHPLKKNHHQLYTSLIFNYLHNHLSGAKEYFCRPA